MIVGIDASRNRSGGAIAHIVGILSSFQPERHGIQQVHLWSYQSLLDQVPDHQWLVKHSTANLEGSLFSQLRWQALILKNELKMFQCDILFATAASTLCRFSPMVVLSQDMLSYETGVMRYFGLSLIRLRLLAILFIQNFAFRRAAGVIFLTRYAGEVIQRSCGVLENVAYVPHGVDEAFKSVRHIGAKSGDKDQSLRCLYVSPVWEFKHQWVVVRAIAALRERGYKLSLDLVGGGRERAMRMLQQQIAESDPKQQFVRYHNNVSQHRLPGMITDTDLFIFASSCENLPITLLEAMAVGVPIVCSNRGPMTEVLQDGGIYFDPEQDQDIAIAIEQLINNQSLRQSLAKRAKALSEQYTWEQCADRTWAFLIHTYALRNETR